MNNTKIRKRLIIVVIMIIIIIIFAYGIINNNIKPVIQKTAEATVRAMATKAFNEAVQEVFIGNVDYESLVNVITDNNGKVTMIQADIVTMNKVATETALIAQRNMQELGKNGIRIPIGSLMKGQLFSGRGPRINIKIIPIGSVTTQFQSEFEHAGINQTQHKIFLKANMRFDIVMASGNSSITVESFVPVSENILIGEVPESFIDVNPDDLINLVPSSD